MKVSMFREGDALLNIGVSIKEARVFYFFVNEEIPWKSILKVPKAPTLSRLRESY